MATVIDQPEQRSRLNGRPRRASDRGTRRNRLPVRATFRSSQTAEPVPTVSGPTDPSRRVVGSVVSQTITPGPNVQVAVGIWVHRRRRHPSGWSAPHQTRAARPDILYTAFETCRPRVGPGNGALSATRSERPAGSPAALVHNGESNFAVARGGAEAPVRGTSGKIASPLSGVPRPTGIILYGAQVPTPGTATYKPSSNGDLLSGNARGRRTNNTGFGRVTTPSRDNKNRAHGTVSPTRTPPPPPRTCGLTFFGRAVAHLVGVEVSRDPGLAWVESGRRRTSHPRRAGLLEQASGRGRQTSLVNRWPPWRTGRRR